LRGGLDEPNTDLKCTRISEIVSSDEKPITTSETLSAIVQLVGEHIGEKTFEYAATVYVSRNTLDTVPEVVLTSALAAQVDVWPLASLDVDTRAYSTLGNHLRETQTDYGSLSRTNDGGPADKEDSNQ
jgi:hypothetical protein